MHEPCDSVLHYETVNHARLQDISIDERPSGLDVLLRDLHFGLVRYRTNRLACTIGQDDVVPTVLSAQIARKLHANLAQTASD